MGSVVRAGLAVGLALVLSFVGIVPAAATAPDVGFDVVPDADGIFDGDSLSPSFEITFSSSIFVVTATPSGGNCSVADCQTSVSCSSDVVSGDQKIGITAGSSLSFLPGEPPSEIRLACPPPGAAPGVLDTRARLTCKVCKGVIKGAAGVSCDTSQTRIWDVLCQAPSKPEFASTPAANQPIVLSAALGANQSAGLTVTNSGTAALTVTPSGLSGALSISPSQQVSIPPGCPNCGFTVKCTPQVRGTVNEQLTLTTNDQDEPTVAYPVSCQGVAPVLASSPPVGSALDLTTTLGTQVTTGITVQNQGDASLVLQPLDPALAAPFTLQPNGTTIAPLDSAVLTLRCSGAIPGTATGSLTISSNAANKPSASYPISCQTNSASAPVFVGVPAPNGPIEVATQVGSSSQAGITVSNTGNAALSISASIASGPPAGLFSATASLDIAAGAPSQPLLVTCNGAGQAAGHYTGTLDLSTNDPNRAAIQYALVCDVQAPSTPEYSSVPPAGALALGAEQTRIAKRDLVVSNVGSASLTISAISGPTGPKIALGSPGGIAVPIVLSPHTSKTFTVTCATGTAGTFVDAFSFSTNDSNESVVTYSPVTCTVTPGKPEFDSQPAAPGNFLVQTPQLSNKSTTLTVNNTGTLALSITDVGGATAPLSVSPSNCTAAAPCQIASGGNKVFTLSCDATNAGVFDRSFNLATNDGDEALVDFKVRCQIDGAPPVFASSPAPDSTLVLNAVVGQPAATTSITVSNQAAAGPAPLQLTLSGLAAPLSVLPSSATVNKGQSQPFTISCNPATAGSFSQRLNIGTNDPARAVASYTVNCAATQPPAPEFDSIPASGSPIGLATGAGAGASANVRVFNRGTATLSVARSLSGDAALTAGALPATIEPGTFADISVNCSGATRGQFIGTLSIVNNDSDENPASYPIFCSVSSGIAIVRKMRETLSTSVFRNGVVNNPVFSNGFE